MRRVPAQRACRASTTRSRNASTGCTPRASATCAERPADQRARRGRRRSCASWKSRCQTRGRPLLLVVAAELAAVRLVLHQLVARDLVGEVQRRLRRRRTPRTRRGRCRRRRPRTAPAASASAGRRRSTRLTKRVTAPMTRCRPRLDLASASVISVVLQRLRERRARRSPSRKSSALSLVTMFGADCRMRPRRRSTRFSRRYSAPASRRSTAAAPSGSDRRRACPRGWSSLDRPSSPRRAPPRASAPSRRARPRSAAPSDRRRAPRPITRARRSEWPRNAVTFGAERVARRGSRRTRAACARSSSRASSGSTCSRGIASTRVNRSEQSSASERIGADRAAAHGDRGDAVAHRLGERRRGEQLGVVVGVHVEEAGHDPLARARRSRAGSPPPAAASSRDRRDPSVTNADVANGPGRARCRRRTGRS